MGKILFIGNDRKVGAEISRVAQDYGHELLTVAETDDDPVEIAKRTLPHLAIIELSPHSEIKGIALASTLLEVLNLSSVFLCATSEKSVLSKAQQSKPLGFIMKPLREIDLRAALALYMPGEQAPHLQEASHLQNQTEANATSDPSNIQIDLNEFLHSILTSSRLGSRDLSSLSDGAISVQFRENSLIPFNGGDTYWPFILYSGRIEIILTSPHDSPDAAPKFIVGLIPPRDLVGLLWMSDELSMLRLRTNRPSTVVFLNPRSVESFLNTNPAVYVTLLSACSQRLNCIATIAESMVSSRAQQRIIQTLLALMPRYSYRGRSSDGCVLDVSRTELARLSGLALETVVRTLSELEQRKIVALHRRKSIEILDINWITSQVTSPSGSIFY